TLTCPPGAPGPAPTRMSVKPSPLTSPAATLIPPRKPGKAKKLCSGLKSAVLPANTLTCPPGAPGPAPMMLSANPSLLLSLAADRHVDDAEAAREREEALPLRRDPHAHRGAVKDLDVSARRAGAGRHEDVVEAVVVDVARRHVDAADEAGEGEEALQLLEGVA